MHHVLSPKRLPKDAIDLVVAVLNRLIVRALGGSAELGRTLAMLMLGEYQPETVRELRLAGEAIGLSLDSLAAFSESGRTGHHRESTRHSAPMELQLEPGGIGSPPAPR